MKTKTKGSLHKEEPTNSALSTLSFKSTNFLHYLLQKFLTIIPISTFFSEEFLTLYNKRKA